MSIAMDKMIKARAGLVLDNPFFGSLALRIKMVSDVNCQTAWINGIELGFNPDFIISLSLDKTKGLIAHEIMHCAMNHHTRRNNREIREWNEACDYAINPILRDSHFALPDGALFDSQFKDKSAEEIFSILGQKKPDDKAENNDSKGSNQQGKGNGQGQGENGKNGQSKGKNDSFGEVRDCPTNEGESQAQANERQAQDWKINTIQAAQNAKAQGSHVPDSIKRMVSEILEPKLDWKEILRRFIQETAKNDYTWQKPNRRYIHQGLYLPSLYSEELGEIILIVDTSGSINYKLLVQFSGELSSILETFTNIKITVIYVDTMVRGFEEFTNDDLPLSLNAKGGGGTSFVPGFTWIEQNEKEPVAVLYMTDGYCNRYPNEPDYPVLWIGTREFEPRFGDFAYLN